MDIESLKSLFSDFDLANLLPKLDSVVGWITTLLRLAVMAGPVTILVLGLIYLFAPPKEANHSFGFRCYFGMGSVAAWRFTQKLAGLVLSVLGLVLSIVMLILVSRYNSMTPEAMTFSAFKSLLWEFGLIAVACIAVHVVVAINYDRFGSLRKPKPEKAPAEDPKKDS